MDKSQMIEVYDWKPILERYVSDWFDTTFK